MVNAFAILISVPLCILISVPIQYNFLQVMALNKIMHIFKYHKSFFFQFTVPPNWVGLIVST